MFILPQILLLGEKVIDKTSFDVSMPVSQHQSSGRMRIDGVVRGEVSGRISGVVHAYVDGDVNVRLLSGGVEEEGAEQPENPAPPDDPEVPEPDAPEQNEKEADEHEQA